jgi:hypothetical protein
MKEQKKRLKEEYLQNPPAMGVFLIRNNTNDKVFVGASPNLPGIINRHKFQLKHGAHPSKALQEDWNTLGSDNFSFEIVDELPPRSDPNANYREELNLLEKLWLERLHPYDERGYNEKKLTRVERLQKIAGARKRE